MKKILKRQSQAESKCSKSLLGQKIGLAPGLESCEFEKRSGVGSDGLSLMGRETIRNQSLSFGQRKKGNLELSNSGQKERTGYEINDYQK